MVTLRSRGGYIARMHDFYRKLQVDPGAEPEVIRAAYHALARKYHPDARGDARRVVEINEAWSVLGNPSRRAAYDLDRARPSAGPVAATPAEQPHTSDAPPRSARDSSAILDFGRYAGWSLQQLVVSDPDYLEWLVRTPIGRRLAAEARELLGARSGPVSAAPMGRHSSRLGGFARQHRDRGLAGRLRFG